MPSRDMALAVLIMAVWGANFVAAKIAMTFFPPLFLMAVRFAIVGALLLPFVRVPWSQLGSIALFSTILGAIHFPLMFYGTRGVDASVASLVAQLQVPFSSLLAAIIFKDYLGWRGALGMALAFGGIVVIAGEPHGDSSLFHIMLIAAASLAFAVANIQIKRVGAIDGFTMNAWVAAFGVPQTLLLSLVLEDGQMGAIRNADLNAWLGVLFVAIGSSVIGHGLWYRLVREYSVNQTMPYLLLIPLFGVISGVLIQNDPLTLGLLIGGGMTVGGVAAIMLLRPATVETKISNNT